MVMDLSNPPKIRNLAFNNWIQEHWRTASQQVEGVGNPVVVQYPDIDEYAKAHGETVMESKLEGTIQGNHGEYADINIYIRYTVIIRWTFSTIDGVIKMVNDRMKQDFAESYPEFLIKEISNPATALKPEIMSLRPDKEGFIAKVKVKDTDRPKDYEEVQIPVRKRPLGDEVKVTASVRKGVKVKSYVAHRRGWDDVEENRALQLRNQNVSYKDIGLVLNRSASSVSNRFYRPERWTSVEGWVVKNAVQRAKDIKSIAVMHKKGKSG